MIGVKAHTTTIATLGGVPVLVEGMAGIGDEGGAPGTTRPLTIIIIVVGLAIVEMGEGDDGILILVERNLPHPVANA